MDTDEDLLERNFDPSKHVFTETQCLHSILTYSDLQHPSWHVLANFVHFLNNQLLTCEHSILLTDHKCLKNICLQLVTLMANDFGLPSLNLNATTDSDLAAFTLNEARRWENMVHPYMIFHSDRQAMTFLGAYIDRKVRRLVNPNTRQFLELDISVPAFSGQVVLSLLTQHIKIFDNFNDAIREVKLMTLGRVMGLDLDYLMAAQRQARSYELTFDNCLKMVAIYLRFMARHPVVIMGETGCGKTSLVEFFSALNIRGSYQTRNLIHVKIHGGVGADYLREKLVEAEKLARENYMLMAANRVCMGEDPNTG